VKFKFIIIGAVIGAAGAWFLKNKSGGSGS